MMCLIHDLVHVLLQVNVYASKASTNTRRITKYSTPLNFNGVSTLLEEEERKTHKIRCSSYEKKMKPCVFIYDRKLEQKLHQAMWDTLSQSTLTNPQGF